MPSVRFLFIGEGSTDDELVVHLERCCVLAGAEEASGVAPDLSRLLPPIALTVAAKLEAALRLEPDVDFVFVHRDADAPDPAPRHDEIRRAVQAVRNTLKYVAVVPVRETEAWLLLDESEVRSVAENPRGSVPLSLPSPSTVENVADPKAHLREAVLLASERTGRRRDRISRMYPQKTKLLNRRLDPSGPVCRAPSWIRMFSDLKHLIGEMA